MNIIETHELGKSYGNTWALSECSLTLPAGHLAALVGPNGAGKTTLMHLAVGLALPSAGTVTVLGGKDVGSAEALDDIAFVAQDTAMYMNLSADDMVHMTRNLNRRFDPDYARARLAELEIPGKRKTGKLSGGQQAQLALTLALARRPRLLILDEPLAALDPLARQDFMATVLAAMVDEGVSVLLSSHALADLERAADFLIVLARGRVQVVGETEELLADHRMLTGPAAEAGQIARQFPVIQAGNAEVQSQLLVRTGGDASPVPPGWEVHPVSLEQLVLAYLRSAPVIQPEPAEVAS
jgi:ABC-2 type transport system ATP-binding protein